MPRQTTDWQDYYRETINRLRSPLPWYPFPALISFGLAILLLAHVAVSTSRRMGHPTSLLNFPSTHHQAGAIWFSVTPINDEVVVATANRQVFRWPQNIRNIEPLGPFIAWLKEATYQEIEAAALLNRIEKKQTIAVIAADQTLKYSHLRPVLYALAQANVSKYGFETIVANKSNF